MKKYEFTGETMFWLGHTLHRIRATAAFGCVEAGAIGGWIEKEENLSHDGGAWVWGDAKVWSDAKVRGDAEVYGNAKVCGNAKVWSDAKVCGNAEVCNDHHYLVIGPIGSRRGFTTFFRSKGQEIFVTCGCFRGDIEEFAEKVRQTHGENEHGKRYMAAIEFAKVCIDLSPLDGGADDA